MDALTEITQTILYLEKQAIQTYDLIQEARGDAESPINERTLDTLYKRLDHLDHTLSKLYGTRQEIIEEIANARTIERGFNNV